MRTGGSGVGDGATRNSELTDGEYTAGLQRTIEALRRQREQQEQTESGHEQGEQP